MKESKQAKNLREREVKDIATKEKQGIAAYNKGLESLQKGIAATAVNMRAAKA